MIGVIVWVVLALTLDLPLLGAGPGAGRAMGAGEGPDAGRAAVAPPAEEPVKEEIVLRPKGSAPHDAVPAGGHPVVRDAAAAKDDGEKAGDATADAGREGGGEGGGEGAAPSGAAADRMTSSGDADEGAGSGDADEDAAGEPAAEPVKPELLEAPREGGGDDLQRISGVGPKLEEMLHGLGVWHFSQIAAWGPGELAWVDEHLEGFKGRAVRDGWVAQARDLLAGGSPEADEAAGEGRAGDG